MFFKAKPLDTKVSKQESEIEKYKWCSYDEAIKLITYDDLRNIFIKCINS